MVKYQNKPISDLPYDYFVLFRRYCLAKGYQFIWDAKEQTIHVHPPLHQKVVNFIYEDADNSDGFLSKVIEQVKTFLQETNLTFSHTTPDSTGIDFHFSFNPISPNHYMSTPNLFVMHNGSDQTLEMVNLLRKQFNLFHLSHSFVKQGPSTSSTPLLTLQCEIPKDKSNQHLASYIEELSISLSDAIISYFSNQLNVDVSSCTKQTLTSFFEQFKSPAKKEKKKPQQKTAEKQSSQTNSIQEEIVQSEVFFDYIFYPSKEDKKLIITGDFHIKNTGNTTLIQPIICLKIDPIDQVSLGGQILPPGMADTFGVHSGESLKGWKYMSDDWFDQAQERGEYWIEPIQSLSLAPGEATSLSSFQVTITENEEQHNQVTIQGIVYFREQDLSFPSNNSIVVS